MVLIIFFHMQFLLNRSNRIKILLITLDRDLNNCIEVEVTFRKTRTLDGKQMCQDRIK